MEMNFEWDPIKAEANRRKHGVSFEEASRLFTGRADWLETYDDEHSGDEERFIAIGPIEAGVIVIVYAEPVENVIRLISVRHASKHEERLFWQQIESRDE